MLENIQMVVFDMAGTTINEKNVVYKTLQKAINDHSIQVDLETVLELGAGKEKYQAIRDIVSSIDPQKIQESNTIFTHFKKLLDIAYQELNVQPIEGVDQTLLNLRKKGIIVVLNTGYDKKVAEHLLQKLKWYKDEHYDLLITASDVEKNRPYPEMIHKAMKTFAIVDAKVVLKAGDSAIDIEEGKNAGCGVTIGVLSGAQTKEQLEEMEPTYILDSLKDLV